MVAMASMFSDTGSGPTAFEPEELPYDDLIEHLVRTTSLGHSEAIRVVGEVLAYFDEPLERFVRRRHGELQRNGLANPAIFARIADELRWWRVAAGPLSERQIRRLIYG